MATNNIWLQINYQTNPSSKPICISIAHLKVLSCAQDGLPLEQGVVPMTHRPQPNLWRPAWSDSNKSVCPRLNSGDRERHFKIKVSLCPALSIFIASDWIFVVCVHWLLIPVQHELMVTAVISKTIFSSELHKSKRVQAELPEYIWGNTRKYFLYEIKKGSSFTRTGEESLGLVQLSVRWSAADNMLSSPPTDDVFYPSYCVRNSIGNMFTCYRLRKSRSSVHLPTACEWNRT